MGGNALKTPTRRMTAAEMRTATDHIVSVLQPVVDGQVLPIPAFRAKPDFGDIDLIVEGDKRQDKDGSVRFVHDELMEVARTHFHATEFAPNTNMLSFDYHPTAHSDGFQVDLIVTPTRFLRTAVNYYSYNDLGNFIGRIAHKMGLKYGHEGLLYLWRDDTHLFRTLTVSADTPSILKCLGYDPKRFENGFDTLKDIFEFASSSCFFNGDLFLLENRNHKARTRDRKRANYNAFLQYIDDNKPAAYNFPDDKNLWLPHIFNHFPDFERQWKQTHQEFLAYKNAKTFFNGKTVGAITGFSGKELGAFMGAFKEHLGDGFAALVASGDPQQVEQAVRGYLQHSTLPASNLSSPNPRVKM